jgi:hypothetical protein
MVGMRMGVENPLQGEALTLDMLQQCVSRMGRGGAGLGIEVQNGINNGASTGFRVRNNILDA